MDYIPSSSSASAAAPGRDRATSQGGMSPNAAILGDRERSSSQGFGMSRQSSVASMGASISEHTLMREDFVDHVAGNWQQDTNSCGLCGIAIGKLRRHHCRICGLCVCAACSPSGFQVDGSNKVQRACGRCVINALRVPAVMQRLGLFSEKLFALCDDRAQGHEALPATHNLLEAASHCEAALSPLEVTLVESRRRAERAEADVVAAGELAHQLQSMLQSQSSASAAADSDTPKARRRKGSRSCSPPASTGNTLYTASRDRNSSFSHSFGGKSSSDANDSGQDLLRVHKTSVTGKSWEDNVPNCSVCGIKFGWHVLKRTHHCRMCGRCVCSGCSPSRMCLAQGQKPVRVCTPCVSDAPRVCAMASRVGELSSRVAGFFGQEVSEQAQSGDLRLMMNHCEAALESVEKMHGKTGLPIADPASVNRQSKSVLAYE